MKSTDIKIGDTIGELTVLSRIKNKTSIIYMCKCNCGEVVKKQAYVLTSEKDNKRCLKCKRKKDPLTKTRNSYRAMIVRCTSPKHQAYDRYSILEDPICERWALPSGEGFENFLSDMGIRPEGLTLDRLDNSKGYCKENCRWASYELQTYNINKKRNNTSGKTGVYWNKTIGKWLAYIRMDNKSKHLGYFENKGDAIAARKKAEIEIYGFSKE